MMTHFTDAPSGFNELKIGGMLKCWIDELYSIAWLLAWQPSKVDIETRVISTMIQLKNTVRGMV